MPHSQTPSKHCTTAVEGSLLPKDVTTSNVSIVHEYEETIRRLLQHLLIAALFSIKLYALPVIFACEKLARSSDSGQIPPWKLLGRSTTIPHGTTPPQPSPSTSVLVNLLGKCRTMVTAPYHVAKGLYTLSKAIEEHPHLLKPATSNAGPRNDHNNMQITRLPARHESVCSSSSEELVEGPATASQVYHAALVNGSTLDDILAAFESADSCCGSHIDVSETRQGTSNVRDGRTHDLSSIQSTPQRMMSTRHAPNTLVQEVAPNIGFYLDAETLKQHLGPSISPQKAEPSSTQLGRVEMSDSVSRKSSCSGTTAQVDETQDVAEKRKPTGVHRCPTFVRRQTQSRLPRRSWPEEQFKHTYYAQNVEGRASAVSLLTGSPVKRGRLQRRVKKL